MKKQLFFAALALTTLAGCTDDSFVGDQSPQKPLGEGAISFSHNFQNVTRGSQDHTTSAATLNNQFIVWGEKSNAAETKSAGTPVFINYVVNYGASSAHTTESNSSDWEYVGQTPYANTKVVASAAPTHVTEQTIKYWDFTNKYYTFTAFSALPGDISDGKVTVTKNVSSETTPYAKGYTMAVKAGASADKIYFADRTLVEAGEATKSIPVTLNFRSLMSQVRFGFYETIPGYSVAITDVKYNSTSHTTNAAGNFGVDCSGAVLVPGASTSFTVTYDDGSVVAANANKAKVAVAGSNTQNYLSTTAASFFGTTLGTSSNTRTWENGGNIDNGNYTKILPNPSNTTDLTLTISYRLTSTDGSGETIDITDATAKVPAAYAKWQSNYAYTYLFKITDNYGLYPITFDAVVVEDEAGNQETITTVATPSITTYANASAVTTDNEYKTGSNIYVVVDNAGTLPTLTADNSKLYLVTNNTGTGATQEITEESVANALANGIPSDGSVPADGVNDTWTVTGVNMKSLIVTTVGVPELSFVKTIPAGDSPTGVAINVDGTNNKGAKFTPNPKYTAVGSPSGNPSEQGWYVESSGTYTLSTDASVQDGTTYYTKDASSYYVFEYTESGNKYYKVIKVVPAPAP